MFLKKILLITYHFPPSAASGTFRLLGMARHLPTFGWQPLVVAPPSLPWEPIDPHLAEQIPPEVIVRHAAYPAGAPKLLRVLAQNAVWLPRAWFACKRLVKEHRPDVILTSGPPHCVHVLGHYLKRSTGLPWVADFRDPWISEGKSKKLTWMQRYTLSWERRVFQSADLVLANAPNACRLFQDTYPLECDKVVTLTNGYDPRPATPFDRSRPDSCLRLLHAGEIYAGRDPLPLFDALAQLNAESPRSYQLQILGRNEIDIDELLRQRGCANFVELQGQRAYQESLDEMSKADILVLFDSPGRTIGVPAKLYEYLGAGRPILALAEPGGDVAAILRESGVLHRIVAPKDTLQIQQALRELRQGTGTADAVADGSLLQRFTRESLTRSLACRLDSLIGQPTSLRIECPTAPAGRLPSPQMQEAEA
jgi:glycosyltransferase involved in cell wall biosynthesis